MNPDQDFTLSCPIPITNYPQVLLAHGGGGKLMHQLIHQMFTAALGDCLQADMDAAVLDLDSSRVAFTTDSYVVHPLFFPGGDIGHLAVNGTVNDLAMAGARPVCLSCAFIVEEGLPMETLWRIVSSIAAAAKNAGVKVVTGDTKVVDRGKGDGIFINTSGIGVIEHEFNIHPRSVQAGDKIIVNGPLGQHGISIMAVREGLTFESSLKSDTAPLNAIVAELLEQTKGVSCMRDLTRGGLASALNEIVQSSGHKLQIDENLLPTDDNVAGACEILGLDPLYVACEGRFVCFVRPKVADQALEIIRKYPAGQDAALIGEVKEPTQNPLVIMRSRIGSNRIVDMISGEQLPRIC